MNRYLLGSLLGGLVLLAAFGSGVVDWARGLGSGNTSGVRVAQQSTTNSTEGTETLERAGGLVQRQSAPTATGQTVNSGNQSASQTVSNPANTSIAQGQPNQSTGAAGGTTGGTAGGTTTGGAATPPPASGTPAPANLESIPALW
ncbi:MAG TPA: hypothetical protein V6D29_07695 [Leptolyngbyaceae cyanobacterium]